MRFLRFMGEGGWAMWFVLAFGLITFATAAGFALRPDRGRRRAMRSLGRATTFSVLTAVSANLAAVGSKVPNIPELANSPRLHLIVMEGISESLAPAILGFALISFAWIVMAIGERRHAREAWEAGAASSRSSRAER
jgi:hypothetical protein